MSSHGLHHGELWRVRSGANVTESYRARLAMTWHFGLRRAQADFASSQYRALADRGSATALLRIQGSESLPRSA